MQIYKSIATGNTPKESFTELAPEVPESDLAMIKPALTHAFLKLTRDPRHGIEYDV